jgi:hypothetical protein
MLEGLYAWGGLQYARFQFRSDIDTPQDMTRFFTGARHVLLTLPPGYEEAAEAGNALRKFRESLYHLQFTVIHTSTRATSLTEFPRCNVVRLDPNDINRWSLPSKALLQRIFVKEFDVAIDFNLDFVLHAAYICKASRAKVRVNFSDHPEADMFFNVQFKLGARKSTQTVYDQCAACLSMF